MARFFNRAAPAFGWSSARLPAAPVATPEDRVAHYRARKQEVAQQFKRFGNFLTSPPRGRAVVSDWQIKEEIKRAKVKVQAYTPFVRDLYNLASGGTMNPQVVWEQHLEPSCHRFRREMGCQRLTPSEVPSELAKHSKLIRSAADFLRNIDFTKVPGRTALEKAVSVLLAMERKGTKPMWGHPGSGGGDPLSASPGNGEKDAKQVMVVFHDMSTLSQDEEDLMLSDSASKGGHADEVTKQREIMEQLLTNPVKQQMLAIARNLDQFSEMECHIPSETIRDAHGDDVRRRQMESFNELAKVDKGNWALYKEAPELFWQRALSRDMMVRERIARNRKKQLLYMLVDTSGSMNSSERIGAACGVLMNRLKAVMAGDAELYYRFFDGGVYQENHVKTRDEAIAAMRSVLKNNYSGGSTSIDGALREGVSSVNRTLKAGSLVKPHIVVVTDGCDEISTSKEDLGDSVLHAFLCGGRNETLMSLAKRSKGVGVQVT